jgi:flagellar basal-body rod protein FlgB
MFMQNNFGKTMDIMHRSMDVSLLRRDVLANNIANSDTPNFKRSVVNFESELKRAIQSKAPHRLQAMVSDSRHIPFHKSVDYRSVKPRKVLDYVTTAKNNGNNVDIEEESMNLLNNQLTYTLMTQAVGSQFGLVNLVLR